MFRKAFFVLLLMASVIGAVIVAVTLFEILAKVFLARRFTCVLIVIRS